MSETAPRADESGAEESRSFVVESDGERIGEGVEFPEAGVVIGFECGESLECYDDLDHARRATSETLEFVFGDGGRE